jgi:hypothetical protein
MDSHDILNDVASLFASTSLSVKLPGSVPDMSRAFLTTRNGPRGFLATLIPQKGCLYTVYLHRFL